ncbi:MAG: Gx transporter family protein [Nitrospinaceae bacterium]
MTSVSNNPLPDNRIAAMALLVAMGVVLHRLEALLPLPSPWIKLGLANIMTLIALVFMGIKEAVLVAVLRVLLASLFGGTFLSPTFFLSLAGTLAATLTMAAVYRKGNSPFSLVGVSVAAAYGHTLAVVLCVYILFIRQEAFLQLLPVFLSLALVSGILTGTAANILNQRLVEERVSFK